MSGGDFQNFLSENSKLQHICSLKLNHPVSQFKIFNVYNNYHIKFCTNQNIQKHNYPPRKFWEVRNMCDQAVSLSSPALAQGLIMSTIFLQSNFSFSYFQISLHKSC